MAAATWAASWGSTNTRRVGEDLGERGAAASTRGTPRAAASRAGRPKPSYSDRDTASVGGGVALGEPGVAHEAGEPHASPKAQAPRLGLEVDAGMSAVVAHHVEDEAGKRPASRAVACDESAEVAPVQERPDGEEQGPVHAEARRALRRARGPTGRSSSGPRGISRTRLAHPGSGR